MKSGASFCTPKTRHGGKLQRAPALVFWACSHLFLSSQIFTDFDEIRHEIENETERLSGNNKVRGRQTWERHQLHGLSYRRRSSFSPSARCGQSEDYRRISFKQMQPDQSINLFLFFFFSPTEILGKAGMALLWSPPRAKENWISQQRLYSLFIKFQPTAERRHLKKKK